MKTNRILLMVVGLLGAATTVRVHAQQDPMYTMYMWNMMTVNPAYAGSAELPNATALVRRQWVGLEGAPATNSLMLHTPLRKRSLGIGMSIVDDRIGPTKNTILYADISYRIRVTKNSRLALGLKAGVSSLRMDMSSVPGTDANDPVYQRDVNGGLRPNFGFGVYYWSKKGYVGLSTPKLLHNTFASGPDVSSVNLYKEASHFFLTGGYVFVLSKDLRLRPSALVKAVKGAPLSADLSTNFIIKDRLWLGAGYRTEQNLSAIVAYQATDQLKAAYAYDIGLSRLAAQHGGSHEIMISYDFIFTKRLLRSPRYF